jgi:hypothetical protein
MTSRFVSLAATMGSIVSKRAAIVGALAVMGTVAWAGCGSGDETRYYCDSTGCFDCDAYGCSSVAPPTHTACTGSASCAPGSVCTSTGCSQTCSDDVACAKGEVCKSGVCSSPTVDPGPTKECSTKADCANGTCVAGHCEACGGSAGPCPCTATADCSSGQACLAGACTAAANTCKFSSECDAGKICADGQCLASCESAPCAANFTCDKGVCQPNPGGGPTCTTDQQCGGDTPQCVGGECAKACSGDAECGGGKFCDQGACVDDTRPHPNCTDDSQCGGTSATPKKCLGGFCKYTCTTAQGDGYCKTIDNRIGSCAKDLVCRTSAEANAQCVVSSECSDGKDCIDNQCK